MNTPANLLQQARGRSARRLGAFCLGLAGLLSVANAQASDVYWSIGVQSPGAVVTLANAPRVVYASPVMVVPAPMYHTGWPPGHRKHWKKHHRRWDDDDHRHGGYRDSGRRR